MSALAAALAAIAATALLHDRALAVGRLQRHVDGAALEGAEAIARGGSVEAEIRRALAGAGLPSGEAVLVEWPLRSGPFAGRREVVRVTVTAPAPARLLPPSWAGTHRIRATAAAVPPHLAGGRPAFVRIE